MRRNPYLDGDDWLPEDDENNDDGSYSSDYDRELEGDFEYIEH